MRAGYVILLIFAGLLAAVIAFAATAGSPPSSDQELAGLIGGLMGSAAVSAILAFLAATPFARIFLKEWLGGVAFVVMLGGGVVGGLAGQGSVPGVGGKARQEAEANALAGRLQANVTAWQAAAAAGRPMPPYQPIGKGDDMGRLFEVANRALHAMAGESSAFRRECDRKDLAPTESPAALARPGGLTAGRKLLAACKASALRHRDAILAQVDAIPGRLAAADADPRLKAEFARGAGASLAAQRPDLDQVWSLQLEILSLRDEQLALLERSRGHWRAQGDNLIFSRQADLDAIVRNQSRQTAIARQHGELRARMAARNAASMGALGMKVPAP